MYWKRLDDSGFKWRLIVAGVVRMNAAQASALPAGMDWTRVHAPRIPQLKARARFSKQPWIAPIPEHARGTAERRTIRGKLPEHVPRIVDPPDAR
ncbi:hypothetical protein FOM02_30825 [Bradyrhizobium sp. SEMIA]|nr:hypothetical protein FOM02_30825 [Bradyrhizobium sp. SEMIA]